MTLTPDEVEEAMSKAASIMAVAIKKADEVYRNFARDNAPGYPIPQTDQICITNIALAMFEKVTRDQRG